MVLAKRIATVDVLSGGRVRMCVGVGWMDEELRATGADPRSRGRRTDETIAAMRTLWAEPGPSGADFDGEFVSFHHAHSFPKPVRPGGVPIHIGGHSEAAARRAGRLGRRVPAPRDSTPSDLADAVGSGPRGPPRRPAATPAPSSSRCRATSRPSPRRRSLDAESAGAARLVVSTSVTADLAQVRDELSAFAERFGLSAGGRRPPRATGEPAAMSARPAPSRSRTNCGPSRTDYAAAVDDRDGERLRRTLRGRRGAGGARRIPTTSGR